MGGWSGQGKGSCGQLSSLIKSRIDGEHPFGPFRLLNNGWCNNNKPGNRKARLPLLNPASFEAKDTSKRKRAEVLTTAKTFTVQHFPPQSLIPNLRANKYRFKLQMNATNCFEASSLEAWKENLGRKPQFASLRIYKQSTSRELGIQKSAPNTFWYILRLQYLECKQTSKRHVVLALPRGAKWTPWSPTQAQRNQIAGVYHLCSERKSRWWPALASQITAIPQCHEAGTKRHCGPCRWDVEEPAAGNPFQTSSWATTALLSHTHTHAYTFLHIHHKHMCLHARTHTLLSAHTLFHELHSSQLSSYYSDNPQLSAGGDRGVEALHIIAGATCS